MTKPIRYCCVIGCTRLVHGREMCYMHYLRERRAGTYSNPNRAERALQFVESCILSTTDLCLEPDFGHGSEYPSTLIGGTMVRLGWLVLERTQGPRPYDTYVMRHVVCGNTRCCNPRHLTWGTEKENAADKKIHGTQPDHIGETNPNARLTQDQVDDIRKRYRKGRGWYDTGNSKELANEYNVTQATIQMIARGKTWRS